MITLSIQQKVIEREKIIGKEYGKGFGGKYYKRLPLITKPILNYIRKKYKKQDRIKIGDIAGGSGILGNAVAAVLRKSGYKNIEVYVLDINPKQLEGVRYEQKHFGNEKIKIKSVSKDILEDLGKFKEFFDIVVCRYLLHYYPKKINKKIIINLVRFLKKDGIASILFITGKTKKYCENLTDIFNYLEKINTKHPIKRYIADKREIIDWIKQQNCKIIFRVLIKMKTTAFQCSKKFLLNQEQINKLSRYLKEKLNKNYWIQYEYYLTFIKK